MQIHQLSCSGGQWGKLCMCEGKEYMAISVLSPQFCYAFKKWSINISEKIKWEWERIDAKEYHKIIREKGLCGRAFENSQNIHFP